MIHLVPKPISVLNQPKSSQVGKLIAFDQDH